MQASNKFIAFFDNPNVQRVQWSVAAVAAAVTCPVAFGAALVSSVAFNILNKYVENTTKRDIFQHGNNFLQKGLQAVKLEKSSFAEGVKILYSLSCNLTVRAARSDLLFDTLSTSVYGFATLVLHSSTFGVLAGLKIGTLAYREVNQLVNNFAPSKIDVKLK